MDENNVCTVDDPWVFEEYEPEDETETPADELTGLLAEWAEMIEEAHGMEVLDISDSSDRAWYFYFPFRQEPRVSLRIRSTGCLPPTVEGLSV
ncbi:hypothetical protein [Natrialba magadii]|uniref:hypothetical protein n=1 Tax=Natrialba magadii TaxID=13769 RepID=UPI0009DA9517|nr:hypothetical protein [Natrialba magadii]